MEQYMLQIAAVQLFRILLNVDGHIVARICSNQTSGRHYWQLGPILALQTPVLRQTCQRTQLAKRQKPNDQLNNNKKARRTRGRITRLSSQPS